MGKKKVKLQQRFKLSAHHTMLFIIHVNSRLPCRGLFASLIKALILRSLSATHFQTVSRTLLSLVKTYLAISYLGKGEKKTTKKTNLCTVRVHKNSLSRQRHLSESTISKVGRALAKPQRSAVTDALERFYRMLFTSSSHKLC